MPGQDQFEIKEKLLARGARILERMGLKLEELKGKVVVDLAAGNCAIETLAKEHGINSVISIDSRIDLALRVQENENRIKAKAQNLPLKDNSVDLLIGNGAPPVITTDEKRALAACDEIERVLKEKGEARIALASLKFIDERILREYLLKKISSDESLGDQFTKEERENLLMIDLRIIDNRIGKILSKADYKIITLLSVSESTKYLKGRGYNIELKKSIKEDDYFWVFKKRKIEENKITP